MVRIAGIVAVVTAAIWAISDLLLLLATARADDYPILARYGEAMSRNAAAMLAVSTPRLTWGALLGVLTGPLYLAGCWQVYQGIRPAGKWLALPPFLLLVYAHALAPFVHGSFVYVGETLRTLSTVDAADQEKLFALFSFEAKVVRGVGAVMAVGGLVGSIWFALAVGKGQTFYPRWMAVFNPALIILAVMGTRFILPAGLSRYVAPASLNVGGFIFYSLSTALLWNAGREGRAATDPGPNQALQLTGPA